jgi:hypothetical protein
MVTRNRISTARENRRQDPTAWGNAGVPDGVRAAEELVEAAARQPVLDRGATESDLSQLPHRDHPMLPRGELGDSLGTWALFAAYIEGNRAQVDHGADGDRSLATGQHPL